MQEPTSLSVDLAEVRSLDVEAVVKPWAERVGVVGVSLQRYLMALGELSDSIALLARTLGLSGQLLVRVEPFTSWITTEFRFPKAVPLDPRFDVQDEELAEFPGIIVQPDIFWRRLILEWVDKAQWSHHGNTVTVSLSQYARRPSSPGELYFLGLSPRPIPGLELRPLEKGLTLALAPNLKTAFRLDEQTLFLLESADGKTPMRDIYRAYVRRFGLVNPAVLGELVEDCVHKGLLIAGDRLAQQSRKLSPGAWLLRLAGLRISVSQSDAFFAALDRWLGWMWSIPALWLMVLLVLSTLLLLVFRFFPASPLEITSDISGIRTVFFPWFVLGLYATITIHEIAHGMACRRLGGRVNEFGLMFYCGIVCAYVDTTDAWMFPKRSDRILVSLAGPLSTLVIGCVFLWGQFIVHWAGAPDAVAVLKPLAFVSLVLALMNLLPVLEFDGYYILVDLLDRPNLKRKNTEYWSTLLGLRRREGKEVVPAREQILYFLYSAGSLILPFFLVVFPLIEALPSLVVGEMTVNAWLSILAAVLLLSQALAQAGGAWFRYRMQQAIDLKRSTPSRTGMNAHF